MKKKNKKLPDGGKLKKATAESTSVKTPVDVTTNIGEARNPTQDVQDFYKSYLTSPNYRKRLIKQGYTNPDETILERLSNVLHAPTEYGSNMQYGSNYNQFDKQVKIDTTQNRKHDFNLGTVLAHEYGHASGDMGNNYQLPFNSENFKMNDSDIQAINSKNLSYFPSSQDHDSRAEEFKADMDAFRYNLWKDKIYNTGTQQFDNNILKKAKKKYAKDPIFERLYGNASDEDLIYLMNNISKNDNNQPQDMAKSGFKLNPKHKGWCTPLSNPKCTGKRRQFAINAKHHFKKQGDDGIQLPEPPAWLKNYQEIINPPGAGFNNNEPKELQPVTVSDARPQHHEALTTPISNKQYNIGSIDPSKVGIATGMQTAPFSPNASADSQDKKFDWGWLNSNNVATGLAAIDALIPTKKPKPQYLHPTDMQFYNPHPYGTDSQAIMDAGGDLSPSKAKEMLKDGTAHGKKLTKKQKQYFGMVASGKAPDGIVIPPVNKAVSDSVNPLSNRIDKTNIPLFNKKPIQPAKHSDYGDSGVQSVQDNPDKWAAINKANAINYDWNDAIALTSGKFKGAKVPKGMIKDLMSSAKSQGLDPWQMIALAGQESTFGKGWGMTDNSIGSKRTIITAGDVYNNYDNPNPEDAFTLAAKRLKTKGVQSYNPGSKKYVTDFNNSMDLLKKDSALSKYVASIMENGGQIDQPPPKRNKQYVDSVLNANKDLNFVQRYLHPNNYPQINNPDGTFSTERMGSGEQDGKYYAYPSIFQMPDGTLKNMENSKDKFAPMKYALKTKQFIQFPTDADARWFADSKDSTSGYKMGTQYDNGGRIAGNGLQVEDNQASQISPSFTQFNGPSHANGGIDINYGGNNVEVEGDETGAVTNDGSFTVFGNMTVPGSKMKFKTAGKKLAAAENKCNNQLDRASALMSESDPKNRFERLTFNSGMLKEKGAQMKHEKIDEQKNFLASLQQSMLNIANEHGLDPQAMSEGKKKKAKSGIKMKAPDGTTLKPVISKIAQKYGIPENVLTKIITQESSFNPSAVSNRGAKGIMQFMPATAKAMGLKPEQLNSNKPEDIEANIDAGAKYLTQLRKQNNGDLTLALAAYNGGQKAVDFVKQSTGKGQVTGQDFVDFYSNRKEQHPSTKPSAWQNQTLDYVNNIMDVNPGETIAQQNKRLSGFNSTYYNNPPVQSEYTPNPTPPHPIPSSRIQTEIPPQETPTAALVPPSGTTATQTPPNYNLDFGAPTAHPPSNITKLGIEDYGPELYGLISNKQEFVPAQKYIPQLEQPYQVSFQDSINDNSHTFNALQSTLSDNPEALSSLSGQLYGANNNVRAQEFRTNQGISADITNRNIGTSNDAQLKNIGILDQQYVRQAQAKSNTKADNQTIINSLSSKILQHDYENKTLAAYENMSNYRMIDANGDGIPDTAIYFGPDYQVPQQYSIGANYNQTGSNTLQYGNFPQTKTVFDANGVVKASEKQDRYLPVTRKKGKNGVNLQKKFNTKFGRK